MTDARPSALLPDRGEAGRGEAGQDAVDEVGRAAGVLGGVLAGAGAAHQGAAEIVQRLGRKGAVALDPVFLRFYLTSLILAFERFPMCGFHVLSQSFP